jgi:hypothetical protein
MAFISSTKAKSLLKREGKRLDLAKKEIKGGKKDSNRG